ncbi:HIRA-interacting protein 3 isoform X2 [Antennarius striatus]|uniref:HIRA-interacting protein 3 isoform X2 n=1 Tax=Antennarius striatus TaxID=241820 RepID=UPI0035B396E7
MMASKKERKSIRRFVSDQLRAEPDLSTLTIGILKRRYLALVCCQSLSPEAKHFIKQVVQEELRKMQAKDDSESEMEMGKVQNKRKRGKEKDEVVSGEEGESMTKKSRHQSNSSDLEDECKTGGEKSEEEEQAKSANSDSEKEEQEHKKSKRKMSRKSKHQISSEDSSDRELKSSEKDVEESNCSDDPKEMVNAKASTTKKQTVSSDTHQGNKTDVDKKSEKGDKSGSSSTDSSETDDEKDTETENTQQSKKKLLKKVKNSKGQKDDHKAVLRLKRYISLCGVRRNYKKLLDGCHSVNAKVAVLKKELQDLGVQGHLSIQKCKKIRKKRAKELEVAELDVNNIIVSEGRPRRKSAWQEQLEPRRMYYRTVKSDSDNTEEKDTNQEHRTRIHWDSVIYDSTDSD